MIVLRESLAAWGTPEFAAVLKREIEALAPASLPLQQCVSATSHALDDSFTAMVIRYGEEPGRILARVGIFFSGIVAGCSCADDPTPVEPQPEYAELELVIDRRTAEAMVVPTGE